MKSDVAETLKRAISAYVAKTYNRETQIFDDGNGYLFITVAEPGMTDSFKLVVSYAGKAGFHIEVADADVFGHAGTHDFHFSSIENAVAAYMAIFTFHLERVLSRVRDI